MKDRGFTPLSEILPGLEGLIPSGPAPTPADAPRPLTIQRKHHFTRAKQINALVRIAEDGVAEMGFLARLLTLCTLPRTDPGDQRDYKRVNGPYRLYMTAHPEKRLPYGNLPRLLLAWVCTEAVQRRERELILGRSLAEFMHKLGMYSDSGGSRGDRTRLKTQIDRLFNASIHLIYDKGPGRQPTGNAQIADWTDLWWDYEEPRQQTLFEGKIRLGETFYNEIITHPIPINMEILQEIKRSPLGIDLYLWLTYRTFTVWKRGKKQAISWEQLYRQFGANPDQQATKDAVSAFRRDALREIIKIKSAWPDLDLATPKGCLEIRPCRPSLGPAEST
jgi:hypothetical protein